MRPVKSVRSEAIVGGLLSLLFLVASLADWQPLRSMESLAYDLYASLRTNPHPSDQIVIVGIDEASLTKVGRWPWPRSTVGELIDILRESGARVIGVGLFLSEPDHPARRGTVRRRSNPRIAGNSRDPKRTDPPGGGVRRGSGDGAQAPCHRHSVARVR